MGISNFNENSNENILVDSNEADNLELPNDPEYF